VGPNKHTNAGGGEEQGGAGLRGVRERLKKRIKGFHHLYMQSLSLHGNLKAAQRVLPLFFGVLHRGRMGQEEKRKQPGATG